MVEAGHEVVQLAENDFRFGFRYSQRKFVQMG